MIVCFLACVKSGHAYVPIDSSVPTSRVQDIVDNVNPEIMLTTEETIVKVPSDCELLTKERIIKTCENLTAETLSEENWLKPQDVFYIIFTSGSTGKPKGVQITTECLVNYVEWAQNLGGGGTTNILTAF